VVVGAVVVDVPGCVSADFSFLEHATTTTEALRTKNIRREIGEAMVRVLQISSRACDFQESDSTDFMSSSFDL
jgi:hypothetical protein